MTSAVATDCTATIAGLIGAGGFLESVASAQALNNDASSLAEAIPAAGPPFVVRAEIDSAEPREVSPG